MIIIAVVVVVVVVEGGLLVGPSGAPHGAPDPPDDALGLREDNIM